MDADPHHRDGMDKATAPPALLEVHLEELGEHSWVKALVGTVVGMFGSAQLRFVARPRSDGHGPRDDVVVGATFPVMRLQDLDDLKEPAAWIDIAQARLRELDQQLTRDGWRRLESTGPHWWSRRYTRGT